MRKILFVALAASSLLACSPRPMNRDVLRLHAIRNCRTKAAVDKQYAVDSTGGVGTRNIAFEQCMREAGFPLPEG